MAEPVAGGCYGCGRPGPKTLCPDCRLELRRWFWSVMEQAGIDARWKDYYAGGEDGPGTTGEVER